MWETVGWTPGFQNRKTILLPLEFEENGELILNYRDSWQLNLKKEKTGGESHLLHLRGLSNFAAKFTGND